MDDHRVVFAPKLRRPFPHLLHKGTGRVVLLHVHPEVGELRLQFGGGPKGRHDHHIFRRQGLQRHQRLAQGVLQELDAAALQIGIHLRVVDHLAQQVNPLAGVLCDGLVADLDRVLHPEAEPKVARQLDPHRPEVQHAWREVLFAGIQRFATCFDPRNDGAPVKVRDVETAHGSKIPLPIATIQKGTTFNPTTTLNNFPGWTGGLTARHGTPKGGSALLLLRLVASSCQALGAVKRTPQRRVPKPLASPGHTPHVSHHVHLA